MAIDSLSGVYAKYGLIDGVISAKHFAGEGLEKTTQRRNDMKNILMAAICIASLSQACSKGETSKLNIYNGQLDSQRDAVGILVLDGQLWCTATLIEEKTLLSAGHCFQGKYRKPKEIYVNFRSGREKIAVSEIIVHPQYSEWLGKVDNDVAVLKLERASSITPEELAMDAPEINSEVLFVGYGRTDTPQKSSHNGTRRRGNNLINKIERNKIHFPRPGSSSMSQVCKGDSGGPVFAESDMGLVQVGIVSGSTDKASRKTCNVTAYAARVDFFYDWIMDQI